MSLYLDIYNDFPLRCAEVWRSTRAVAQSDGREVTLMLMAATAGLATPWEHLNIQPGQAKDNCDHPAFNGFRDLAYKRALKIVEKALSSIVSESRLFVGVDYGRWRYGHAAKLGLIRNMVEQGVLPTLPLTALKAKEVVNLLRNALSHNSLYAFGGPPGSEISHLTFFQEHAHRENGVKVVNGYDVLSLPVGDLEAFLENWFAMLEEVARANSETNRPRAATLKLVISQALEGDDARAAA